MVTTSHFIVFILLSWPKHEWRTCTSVYDQASISKISTALKLLCEVNLNFLKLIFNKYLGGSTAHVQTGSEHVLCAAPEGLLVGCTGCSESFSNLTHATHHSGCYKVRNCLGFLFLFYSQSAHTALPQMSVFREREREKKMVWCGLK